MTTSFIHGSDVDPDDVASRLRDLAHDIENGNAPVQGFAEETGVEESGVATISISVEVLAGRQTFTVDNVGVVLGESNESANPERGSASEVLDGDE